MLVPGCRHRIGVVVHVVERETAESRRQRIVTTIVGYAQGALEFDPAFGVRVHFRELEHQPILPEFDHRSVLLVQVIKGRIRLPTAISHLSNDPQDCMVRHLLELPQHVREQPRPAQDDLSQVAGDLACHCQQHVRVFIEFFRQSPDGRLGRWRYLVPLDLAQIRRLHPDAPGDLADGEGSIPTPSPLAGRPGMISECHVYDIVHILKFVNE